MGSVLKRIVNFVRSVDLDSHIERFQNGLDEFSKAMEKMDKELNDDKRDYSALMGKEKKDYSFLTGKKRDSVF